MHLKWEKRHCENVLHRLGEGRDAVAHNDPHVQFWDKKLEGRKGAGLLLSSRLCRHMVIIWSSFEHAASLLTKRAAVQHESRTANMRANFLLLQKQKKWEKKKRSEFLAFIIVHLIGFSFQKGGVCSQRSPAVAPGDSSFTVFQQQTQWKHRFFHSEASI